MATNRAAPSLQTADLRPISFLLDDSVSGIGAADPMTFYIRPEELARQEQSRVNVVQTLGGAWGDSFGKGVPSITLSGHTGWRRDQDGEDGEGRFRILRDQFFDQWHERRAAAVKNGRDPAGVKLVFADSLNSSADVVAPISFTLRRSRSRPLLLQYQIQMAVLGRVGAFAEFNLGGGLSALGAAAAEASGLDSLMAAISKIQSFAGNVKSFVDRSLVAPVQAFMNKTTQVYQKVVDGIRSIDGVASSLKSAAGMMAQAGANIFRTLSAVVGLPAHIKGQLIDVAASYTNIFCVLKNSLKGRAYYEDYSSLYGASNCSSTSGGRPLSPLAGVNAFAVTNPAPVAPLVAVTPDAQAAMVAMAKSDVALAPLPVSVVGSYAGAIASGVVLA